jgi:hypothetical protein
MQHLTILDRLILLPQQLLLQQNPPIHILRQQRMHYPLQERKTTIEMAVVLPHPSQVIIITTTMVLVDH